MTNSERRTQRAFEERDRMLARGDDLPPADDDESARYVCRHCGNDRRETRVERRIRINRQWTLMKFCCQEAGGDYQMGCEG